MADHWNDDSRWNDGGQWNEGDQWNEVGYGSYAALDEHAMPDYTASPMERRVSDQSAQSRWSQPSSGGLSWPVSTPPDEWSPGEPNEGFLFSPESPVLDSDYCQQFAEAHDSSFVQPLDYAEGYQALDVEEAARHATQSAAYHLEQYRLCQCPELVTTFITSDNIDATIRHELSHVENPTQYAIQALLYRALCGGTEGAPDPDADTLLVEAAYHLQLRTQGPPDEVFQICQKALAATLRELGGRAPESDPPHPTQAGPSTKARPSTKPKKTPKSEPEKKQHVCRLGECADKPRPFRRNADLERHQDDFHGGKKYPCDYRWCSRHREPFRRDHYRDHLRATHFEDLPLRGPGKMDAVWWAQRSRSSVAGGWWRCNKCLRVRVSIAEYDFICPGCGSRCEADRIDYRTALEEGGGQENGEDEERMDVWLEL